jgi:type I restriction enzyme S subunit
MRLFPESWRVEPASSVCSEIVDCLNKTAPTVEMDTGLKMIRTTNVKSGRINLDDVRFVEEKVFRKWTRRLLPRRNDIVLTREAPLGEVGLLRSDDKAMLGQRTMVYRADGKNLDQIFLYYSLLGPVLQAQIKTLGSGSTVEHMRVPDAETLAIPLPRLAEQRKVAALLSAYDDLIENNRRRIALLERMAEQLYREWFVRFRFPGYQQAKFAKGLPVDWKLSTLGEIATFVMGQSPSSEFYNESGEGLPFHQGVGTYGSRFPNNIVFCSVDGRKAKAGDILFSVRAPVGRLNIADCDVIIGRGLAAIRHKQGFNSYLFNLLKVAFANEDIIGNGAIFNSVGKDELSKFAVFSPPQPLVRRFDEMACSIEKQLEVLTESIRNLVKTRDLLLPRLISGKLRVDELDIQFPPSMQTERA